MNSLMNLSLIGVVFLVTVQAAQDTKQIPPATVPDLTGTWVFNLSKSDIGSPGGSPLYDELTLTIVHREPEIQIVRWLRKKKRETTKRLIYYSDKRGESNPTMVGNSLRSKTSWEGNVLVSAGTMRQGDPFDTVLSVLTETIERWELSPDGNTLTQTSLSKGTLTVNGIVSPPQHHRIVRVFEKNLK